MSDSFNRKVFLRFALERLKNNLFPSRCYTCLEPLLFSQHLLCVDCVKSLPYIDNACIRCSESLSHSGICPNCQKNPPYFNRCIALCNYQYPVSTALKNIKKNAYAPETKKFSMLLLQRLKRIYRAQSIPKIIIPIPAHPIKTFMRGFNQSELIANFICTGLENTQLHQTICYRKQLGKPQKSQTRAQRLRLLSNAFKIKNSEIIEGKSLAVVDDIVTTGATANAVSQSLISAGAKSVDLWCIAKTSWHNHSSSIKI